MELKKVTISNGTDVIEIYECDLDWHLKNGWSDGTRAGESVNLQTAEMQTAEIQTAEIQTDESAGQVKSGNKKK